MAPPRSPDYASLIGDLVGSRRASDRRRLHDLLRGTLAEVNADLKSVQPLTATVGDEFQAVYPDLATALFATLLIRLRLTGASDARFGIGLGPLEVYEEAKLPFEQDGPAWWAARDAIGRVAGAMKKREGPRGWRTACVISDSARVKQESSNGRTSWHLHLLPPGTGGDEPHPGTGFELFVNAVLVCRDEVVGQMDDRDARITLALLRAQRQADIARSEGISQSAVAQRILRSGAYAVLSSHQSLLGDRSWNQSASG